MEFKHRLKKYRAEKGFTQDALAKRIFVSRSAIAKWEAGLGMPNEESLAAICQALEITKDDLFPNKGAEALLVEKNINIKRKKVALIALAVCLALSLIVLGGLLIGGAVEAKQIAELTPSIDKIYFERKSDLAETVVQHEGRYRLYTNHYTQVFVSVSADVRLDFNNLQITFDKGHVFSCVLVNESSGGEVKNYVYKVSFKMLEESATELNITLATYRYLDKLANNTYKTKVCEVNAKPLPIAVSDNRTANVTLKFNAEDIISFEIDKGESVESGIFDLGEQRLLIDNFLKTSYPQLSGKVVFEGWERSDGLPLYEAVYDDLILYACARAKENYFNVEASDLNCSLLYTVYPNFTVDSQPYTNVIYTLNTESDCVKIGEKGEIKGVKPGVATVFAEYDLGFYSGRLSFSVTVSDKAFIRVLGYKKELATGVFTSVVEGVYNYETGGVELPEKATQELYEYFDGQNSDYYNATGQNRRLVELRDIGDATIVPVFDSDCQLDVSGLRLEIFIGSHHIRPYEDVEPIVDRAENLTVNGIGYSTEDALDTDWLAYFEADGVILGEVLPDGVEEATLCFLICFNSNGVCYYNTYKIPIVVI